VTEPMEWRRVYPGREVLFASSVAVGDVYPVAPVADGEVPVFRVRLWGPDRLQGGRERLVLGEDAARTMLQQMLERARREEGAA